MLRSVKFYDYAIFIRPARSVSHRVRAFAMDIIIMTVIET